MSQGPAESLARKVGKRQGGPRARVEKGRGPESPPIYLSHRGEGYVVPHRGEGYGTEKQQNG